jgi:glycosyltransferase involved in cell wall biosynthesis
VASGAASCVELIIIDLGSDDETRSIGRYVPGAKVLRFSSDIGWSRAADAGRQLCSASAVLFLSSEASIAPGSLQRASTRLAADPSIGAIGGMILQPHGVIAQAGGILWNDGSTHDYKRGASPLLGEANFVRDVDFCAPAFLLVRATLLSQIDGFDYDCSPGYGAIDLCLRIAQAGSRVVYDPSVMIVLGDPLQPADPGDHFLRKHAAALAERFAPGGPLQAFARHAGPTPHRVLFIEDTIPLRRIGSGFVRANDLLRTMASAGYAVTVFPVNGCEHDPAHVFSDMPDQVEALHAFSVDDLAAFLEARPGYYDTVWVARAHNLAQVRPILARLIADGVLHAQIVLDTEAVTPNREAGRAALTGQVYDVHAGIQAILVDAELCQQVVAVTRSEADTLIAHGFPSVSVIGHTIGPKPTDRPFAQRAGMLFVGAIHNQDSPNFDSLVWFVDEVLPLLEAELKWETRLTVAGYLAPDVDLARFANHPRITLRGEIADLEPLYSTHRIFVAPTRYAAGAPYKVLEAASRGLPVVATEILRTQLGWQTPQEIVAGPADDPAAFAAGVMALYRDERRWLSVRDGALGRLRQENGAADFAQAVISVLTSSHEQLPRDISRRKGTALL